MSPDFEDNWTTPKHLKIEREGEPRGLRRGPTKKKDRRKGQKARMDEIVAARNQVKRYYDWAQEDKQRNGATFMRSAYTKWHAEDVQKLRKLLKLALADGIITQKGAEHVQERICVL